MTVHNSNLQMDGDDQDSSTVIIGYCPDMFPAFKLLFAKDDRTILWDTNSAEIASELPGGTNSNFDEHWPMASKVTWGHISILISWKIWLVLDTVLVMTQSATELELQVVAKLVQPFTKREVGLQTGGIPFLCLQKILTLLQFADLDVQTHAVQGICQCRSQQHIDGGGANVRLHSAGLSLASTTNGDSLNTLTFVGSIFILWRPVPTCPPYLILAKMIIAGRRNHKYASPANIKTSKLELHCSKATKNAAIY
ncbi:hypothetical protein Tco_0947902 [Tanacetum coccineum]